MLNLECCISTGGAPWSDPRKPFFFHAPPAAVDVLSRLGVDCVTLANNHALDFGADALLDTLEHLRAAGIAVVGAGAGVEAARSAVALEAKGLRLAVSGVTDHPAGYAAGPDTPGVAYADLGPELPDLQPLDERELRARNAPIGVQGTTEGQALRAIPHHRWAISPMKLRLDVGADA